MLIMTANSYCSRGRVAGSYSITKLPLEVYVLGKVCRFYTMFLIFLINLMLITTVVTYCLQGLIKRVIYGITRLSLDVFMLFQICRKNYFIYNLFLYTIMDVPSYCSHVLTRNY